MKPKVRQQVMVAFNKELYTGQANLFAESIAAEAEVLYEKLVADFRKIETNRLMRDKKICFDFVEPFSYINIDSSLWALEDDSITKNKKREKLKNTDSPVWWTSQTKPRTSY